ASINDELERDHLVMVSFFKAIRVISPQRKWICLSLRRGVERRVFQHLRCERREQQRERPVGPAALEHRATRATAWLPDGDSLWPAMKTAEHADGCEGHEERAARAALLAQIARGVLDYEELELLLA